MASKITLYLRVDAFVWVVTRSVLIFFSTETHVYLVFALYWVQTGKSALQVWGISLRFGSHQDAVVEDEHKEAFEAHTEALMCCK